MPEKMTGKFKLYSNVHKEK